MCSQLDVGVGEASTDGQAEWLEIVRKTNASVMTRHDAPRLGSPTYQQLLSTPTVTMPLTDLYQITGTTDTEPATFITVTVADDAAVTDVQAALQATYPELQIRTNRQQLETTLERQVLVVAAGGALVVVAVGAGITLTFSLFALIVYQQRREFAIMSAQGISPSIVIIVVITEGLAIGTLAAAVAGWQLTRTPPLTHLE